MDRGAVQPEQDLERSELQQAATDDVGFLARATDGQVVAEYAVEDLDGPGEGDQRAPVLRVTRLETEVVPEKHRTREGDQCAKALINVLQAQQDQKGPVKLFKQGFHPTEPRVRHLFFLWLNLLFGCI